MKETENDSNMLQIANSIAQKLVDAKFISSNHDSSKLLKLLVNELSPSKITTNLRSSALLSTMRALWGNITPNVRGVSVEYSPEKLMLHAHFDNKPTRDEVENMNCALSEILSDLYQEVKEFELSVIECSMPQKLETKGLWVFVRHED